MTGIKVKLRQKLNSRAGFTLTELLLATIILLLVSAIVAEGIPVAREAYEKVVLTANGDVLISTTVTALRNELGMAQVEPGIGTITPSGADSPSNTIIYYNVNRGAYSALFLAKDGYGHNTIFLQRYIAYDPVNKVTGSTGIGANSDIDRLIYIGDKDSRRGTYITFDSVIADNPANPGVITFENLKVMHGNDEVTAREKISIRVMPKE